MNASETTARYWLEKCKGWFTMGTVPYRVKGGYSDIDLLAFDPKANEYYAVEVKAQPFFRRLSLF